MKDWTGNSKTTFVQLGSSSHSDVDREQNDFYSTDPDTLKKFLTKLHQDNVYLNNNIWECACGMGHLSTVLEQSGYSVMSTDLYDRGFGITGRDFLKVQGKWSGDILTNPPYKYALEFVEKALDLVEENNKVIMLLKIQFLETKSRKELFERHPPKYIYVHSERQLCYLNGDMTKKISSATCYCWFIWEKGFCGEPVIRWI